MSKQTETIAGSQQAAPSCKERRLKRASFFLGLASLPPEKRSAVYGIIELIASNLPSPEYASDSGVVARMKQAVFELIGKQAAPSGEGGPSRKAAAPKIDLSASTSSIEQQTCEVFADALGLDGSGGTAANEVLGILLQDAPLDPGSPLAEHLAYLESEFEQRFPYADDSMKAALDAGDVLAVTPAVKSTVEAGNARIQEYASYFGWVLQHEFGAEYRSLSNHEGLYGNSASDLKDELLWNVVPSQFLDVLREILQIRAQYDREKQAFDSARAARAKAEEELADLRDIEANYDSLVGDEESKRRRYADERDREDRARDDCKARLSAAKAEHRDASYRYDAEVKPLAEKLKQANSSLRAAQKRREAAEEALSSADRALRSIDGDLNRLRSELRTCEDDQAAKRRDIDDLHERLRQADDDTRPEIQKSIDAADRELNNLRASEDAMRKAISTCQAELDAAGTERRRAEDELRDARRSESEAERIVSQTKIDHDERYNRNISLMGAARTRCDEAERDFKKHDQAFAKAAENEKKCRARIEEIHAKHASKDTLIPELESRIAQASTDMEHRSAEMARHAQRCADMEEEFETNRNTAIGLMGVVAHAVDANIIRRNLSESLFGAPEMIGFGDEDEPDLLSIGEDGVIAAALSLFGTSTNEINQMDRLLFSAMQEEERDSYSIKVQGALDADSISGCLASLVEMGGDRSGIKSMLLDASVPLDTLLANADGSTRWMISTALSKDRNGIVKKSVAPKRHPVTVTLAKRSESYWQLSASFFDI